MPVDPYLKDCHEAFGDCFRQLAVARSGLPVFAIEHDLDSSALLLLRRQVSRQLEIDPDLTSVSWGISYLPLVVIAAEAGYRYRGTGTDFWPLLARDLELDPRSVSPADLSYLFELSHRSFGLVRPGDSVWEQHFPHISWPIANAAVPLEVQGPLASALRAAVRAGISPDNKDALLGYVRNIALGQAGRRFENWLQRGELSQEVMTRLLDPVADGWLTETFIRRLDADVRRDVESRRAIGEARRLTARRLGRQPEIPASRFLVTLNDDVVVRLSARGPVLPAELRDQVVATLRTHGDVLRTTMSQNVVELRHFLAGGELDLGTTADWPHSPLRRGGVTTQTSPQAALLLDNLQPKQTEFFRLENETQVGVALLQGEQIEQNSKIVRIRNDGDCLSVIQRLDASLTKDAEILRKHGWSVRSGRPIVLYGLPMPGAGAHFAASFPLLARKIPNQAAIILDQTAGASDSLAIDGGEWAVFTPEVGEHTVGVDGFDEASHLHFWMVDPPDIDAASVAIHPASATLTDLLEGTMEIRIRAPLPLENVQVQARVMVAGEEDIVSEDRIDRLPVHIAGRMPLLRDLRTSVAKRGIGSAAAARLQIHLEGVLTEQFMLLPTTHLFLFDEHRRSWADAQDSGREIGSRVATLSNLFPSKSTAANDEFMLLVPDSENWGALGAGRILRENNPLRLGKTASVQPLSPRTIREARSRDGIPGLDQMTGAYLAWRLAEASDPLSYWAQHKAAESLQSGLVSLLCGDKWRQIEERLNLAILSPAGALYASAERYGLLSGDDLPSVVDAHDADFLARRIRARLHQAIPDQETAIAEWSIDLGGELDLAVIEAYEDLRKRMLDEGRDAFEEPDMKRDARTWLLALERARETPRLSMFQALILPNARWESLSAFSYETATEDEIVDLLDGCHVDAFRRPGLRWIGRAELRAILELWISPRSLLEAGEWQRYLAKSLSDTQTARAVRYAALRRKLSRMDFPEESLS